MPKPENESSKQNGNGQLKRKLRTATQAFEDAVNGKTFTSAKYILRLYVTGSSTRSLKAVYNLKKICEEYLLDEYDLEVIDINENPRAAREEQIIAVPTLVKQLPEPLRKLVGDLSNTQKVLVGLEIYRKQEAAEPGDVAS
jgi:circadian clock protein KaiB